MSYYQEVKIVCLHVQYITCRTSQNAHHIPQFYLWILINMEIVAVSFTRKDSQGFTSILSFQVLEFAMM